MASQEASVIKVAVEGCCHGELDNIYTTIEQACKKTGAPPPDVLICCGDFQSFRNCSDLNTFAAPPKYRRMGDFWKYYNNEKVAPILTIFVGGNHEASGYLWELFHGGWVAPNIYFLGIAGSVVLKKTLKDGKVHKIRISGASGIYKRHDYRTGHHERLPYDNSTIRSIYHIRQYDVLRLKQLPLNPADIFVSHDWPVGIEQFGNTAQLIRAKPFFRDEIASNTLGSPPLMEILQTVKPSYWFSAHLHVKFAALVRHNQQITPPPNGVLAKEVISIISNPDELDIDVNDSDSEGVITSTTRATQIENLNPDSILLDDVDEGDDICLAQKPECLTEGSVAPSDLTSTSEQIRMDGSHTETARHQERQSDVSLHATANSAGQNARIAHGIGSATASLSQAALATTVDSTFRGASLSDTVKMTRFLALDKCLPRKDFLQIIDIPLDDTNREICGPSPLPAFSNHTLPEASTTAAGVSDYPKVTLHYDPHWLAITRAFHTYLPLSKHENQPLPMDPVVTRQLVETELQWIETTLAGSSFKVDDVQKFTKTAPGLGEPGGDDWGQR